VIATICEKYMVYAAMEGGFSKEQIISTSPLTTNSIFQMVPMLKEKLKTKLDYNNNLTK
jgi:F0F1-type ATP synthase delta subunit